MAYDIFKKYLFVSEELLSIGLIIVSSFVCWFFICVRCWSMVINRLEYNIGIPCSCYMEYFWSWESESFLANSCIIYELFVCPIVAGIWLLILSKWKFFIPLIHPLMLRDDIPGLVLLIMKRSLWMVHGINMIPWVGCFPRTGIVIVSKSWNGSLLRTTLYAEWLSSSGSYWGLLVILIVVAADVVCLFEMLCGWLQGNEVRSVLPIPSLLRFVVKSDSIYCICVFGVWNIINCKILVYLFTWNGVSHSFARRTFSSPL